MEVDGSGCGCGSGYGSGSGDGYGDGSGDGYGDGCGDWVAVAKASTELASKAQSSGATLGFWWSDKNGMPCNGGNCAKPVTIGEVQVISGPLRLCGPGALHATLDPSKWNGDRLWVVALWGEVLTDGDKLGALKREILAEVSW